MDVVVENPYARRALLESPPLTPGSNPPGTPQHAPRPSRLEPAPTSGKRDRSKSASDKVLGQDDLRHGLKPIYGGDSMEELFDSNNKPTPEFLRRIRRFIGDLVYGHFGNS